MAEDLTLVTVAEGIETEPQLDMLRREGCISGQGFLFSVPLTVNEMSELLKRRGPYPLDDLDAVDTATSSSSGHGRTQLAVAGARSLDAESELNLEIGAAASTTQVDAATASGTAGSGGRAASLDGATAT